MIQRYKLLILSIVLCFWTSILWAQAPQPTWELKTDESAATKNYVARQSITLESNGTTGFHFKADGSKTFSAKIDAGLLFPPTANTYAMPDGTITTDPTQGAVVGSIPGSASVSPAGAATYQIPIEVPSGVNGMQPQVSIAYNSQGGFGALGMGWDISGGSGITRGPKNIYFDGQNNNVKFDNTDALYLDGQRLIYLSGGTGNLTAGATYGTELENYARVIVANTSSGGIYFIVTTKEGKTMEYGNSAKSLVSNVNSRGGRSADTRVLAWKLNKVTDTYGNSMTYTYSYFGQYLAQIDYAGQSVVFTYRQNTVNPKRTFISDFLVARPNILDSIITKSGTTPLKTFEFKYTTDNRLNAVDETLPDNTKLNSTIINWGAESDGAITLYMGNNLDVNLGINKGFVCTGDVNGDGYPDRIEMWSGAPTEAGHIIVYLFDKDTHKFSNTGISISLPYYDPATFQPKMVVSDINNDGKDEMILVNGGRIHTYSYQYGALVVDIDGNSINTDVVYHSGRSFEILSADVNHDNYNDIILVFNNFRGNGAQLYPGYIVFPGSANGLIDKTVSTEYFVNDNTFTRFQIGDFNADGKIDFLGLPTQSGTNENLTDDLLTVVSKSSWGDKTTNTLRNFTGDFNGDGLSDLLVESNSHTWSILENTSGFNSVLDPKNQTFTGTELYTIDFNGDGLVDIVTGNEIIIDHEFDHIEWDFYKNKGGSFNSTPDYQAVTYNQISKLKGFVTDINGDGVADLIIPDGNHYTALTIPNSTGRNLVTGITNGMGQTNTFAYKNFSNYDQTTSNAPLRNVKTPIMVVDTETEPDGIVTAYTFEKPKAHTEGKGFLGFTTVTAVNAIKNAKIVSNYEIEPNYFGVNLSTQKLTTADGSKTMSISRQYNGVKVIDAAKKRYIPIVTAQTTFDQLKNIRQTSIVDYSLYPNSTTQTTTVKDSTSGVIDLTTQVITTFTGPNGVTPYLPATVTTTRTQNGQSDTRSTGYAYVYDSAPNIYKINKTTETTDPQNSQYAVSTEHSNPDTWGHMQTVTIKAKDQYGAYLSRTLGLAYTPSGRFVISKTDVLNQTTTYNWDETNGLLNNEITIIGGKNRITSYKYNNWGQLVETTYPDGMRKANVLQWNNDDTARYYTYTEASGSSPVWVYYDNMGRELKKETKGLNENVIRVFTTYRTDGKVDKVSDPTFNTTFNPITDPCTAYGYNTNYGYLESVKTPLGTTTTVYDKLKTTVTSPEGTVETVSNAAGQTLTSTINGKTVTYTYYPSGLTNTSTPDGGQPLQMVYNLQGKRTNLIDPDGGTVETVYDGFGELLTEKQKVHNATDFVTTTNTYDDNGLLLNINRNGEITTYTYDTNDKSRVNAIEITGKNKQTFTFDDYDRVTNVTEDITANGVTRTYNTGKEYDVFGRVKKEIYPSGYYTVNTYDNYSNLAEVKDNLNRSIWKANTENALGQATSIFKGAKETKYEYDPVNHLKTSIFASGVVDYSYGYYSDNNLQWRADNLTNQSENFTYDTQNRLTNWDVTRSGTTTYNSLGFDGNGNITQKSDLGAFTLNYGGQRADGSAIGPHALATISGVPSNFPTSDLSVTYTDFKKIAMLDEGTKHYELTYGVDDERRMSVYYANGKSQGAPTLTRYYLGNYEEEINSLGKVRKIHYLSGAILIQNEGKSDSLLYTYSDAQGSLIALTDANGVIVRRYAYDPWGVRRDADNWNAKDNGVNLIVNRGYTGHEHLDAFGIINMNGRVYDPLTAMFFSPDPYVQAPGNWLNYNRYGYCYGNPFSYTDPSGELQIGPFYLSLNIGWSPQGGPTLGISAGVGIENVLSVGVGINYGFKTGNFSATLNASAFGGYITGGYDTKSGWMVGAGYAAPSVFSGWSPVSFSTNILSAGVDYSENGGFSADGGGFSYGSGGLSFNPSIGASITGKFGDEYMKGSDNVKLDPNDKSGKPDVAYGDNEGINKKADKMMKRPSKLNKIYADGTGDVGAQEGEYVYAKTHWEGWTADVYLSEGAFKSNHFLSLTLQHEYSHIYITNRLGFARDRNRLYNENLNEYTAWSVTLEQAKIWGEYVKFAESQVNYYNIDNYKPIYAPNSIMTFKKIPW